MRRFLPEEVRNEIIEHLTDTEKKELGQIPYLVGFFFGIAIAAQFVFCMLIGAAYGGVGFLVGAVVCFIAVLVPTGLFVRSGYESWLRETAYAKSLNIQNR